MEVLILNLNYFRQIIRNLLHLYLILEFKYKADQDKNVETDENGYVLRDENESLEKFTKRLLECSSQFRDVIYYSCY